MEERHKEISWQLIFEQGNSFYICSKLCEREINEVSGDYCIYYAPQIVNLVLACELYLKALLAFAGIPFDKTHHLDKLFECLPKETKHYAEKAAFQKYGTLTDAFGTDLMSVCANAFVEWRYSFEKKSLTGYHGYLQVLATVLQDLCCRDFYGITWETYARGQRIEKIAGLKYEN